MTEIPSGTGWPNPQRVSTGGAGGITEIAATDDSVTVTNPTGPIVGLSANGGSLPHMIGPFTVPFDDPGVNNTYTVLTPLAAKTTVLRVLAFNHGWASTPDGDGLEITVDVQDSTDVFLRHFEVYRCDAMTSTDETVPEVSGSAVAYTSGARTPDNSDDYELAAYLFLNGADTPSAGSIVFYALVNVET